MLSRIQNEVLSASCPVAHFRNLSGHTHSAGPEKRFKSWLGHPYMVGIISSPPPPGLNRVRLAAKRCLGRIPTVLLYSAGLALHIGTIQKDPVQ